MDEFLEWWQDGKPGCFSRSCVSCTSFLVTGVFPMYELNTGIWPDRDHGSRSQGCLSTFCVGLIFWTMRHMRRSCGEHEPADSWLFMAVFHVKRTAHCGEWGRAHERSGHGSFQVVSQSMCSLPKIDFSSSEPMSSVVEGSMSLETAQCL